MQEEIQHADHAARTGPPTGAQFGRLGQIYHADFCYPEAAVCYALAEELNPSDYRWPYYRGVLDSEIGRHDVALGHFQRVLSLHPDDPCARLRVGDVYFKMRDYAKATEAYRQALAWPAYRPHALLGLAHVAERQGQWQHVVELLEEPVLSGRCLGPAFRLLMSAYHESGRSGDVDRLTSLGEYYGVGNAVAIDDPAIRALEELSSSSTYLLKQASLAQAAKDEQRRLQILSRAVQIAPDDLHVQLAICDCYQEEAGTCFAEGRPGDARRLLAKSLPHAQAAKKLDPRRARAHVLLGKALEHTDTIDKAIQSYRQALALDPLLEEPHYLLGKALATAGRFDEAVSVCQRAVELSPESFAAWFVLGKALAGAGRGDEAIESLQHAKQLMAISPFPDCEIAKVLVTQGKREEGITLLREVLSRWPDCLDARDLVRGLESSPAGAKRLSP